MIIINKLLEFGANINIKNNVGSSVLILAAINAEKTGNDDILKLLLLNGADYTVKNNNRLLFFDCVKKTNILEYIKIINELSIIKHNMMRIHHDINRLYANIIMSPTSLRTKIAAIKWRLDNSNHYSDLNDIIGTEIWKYLCLNDINDLFWKITDITKYSF